MSELQDKRIAFLERQCDLLRHALESTMECRECAEAIKATTDGLYEEEVEMMRMAACEVLGLDDQTATDALILAKAWDKARIEQSYEEMDPALDSPPEGA